MRFPLPSNSENIAVPLTEPTSVTTLAKPPAYVPVPEETYFRVAPGGTENVIVLPEPAGAPVSSVKLIGNGTPAKPKLLVTSCMNVIVPLAAVDEGLVRKMVVFQTPPPSTPLATCG